MRCSTLYMVDRARCGQIAAQKVGTRRDELQMLMGRLPLLSKQPRRDGAAPRQGGPVLLCLVSSFLFFFFLEVRALG